MIHWFGEYHFIFLHFPLACVILAGISELLFILNRNQNFQFVARFLVFTAALFSIPTVLAGLALIGGNSVEAGTTLWWHRFFGITVFALSFITAYLSTGPYTNFYRFSLLLLVIDVLIVGYLGGKMTFHSFRWLPPI